MLCRPLGAALGPAVQAALARDPHAVFVPVPTGRAAFRRRGYRVPDLLLRSAGQPVTGLLAPARATADQRELGRAERERNVRGSMRAVRGGADVDVLLVDDVVTTGATLDEAAAVLTLAGLRVRGAVVLAATPRHAGRIRDTVPLGGDIH